MAGSYSQRTRSYIPAPDLKFGVWVQNFSTLLTASPTTYGLVSGDATAVAALVVTWQAAFAIVAVPATKTKATVAAKDNARAALEAAVRPRAVKISSNPAVAVSDKIAIGVTPRDNVRTYQGVPKISPQLTVDYATPGTIVFRVIHAAAADQVGQRQRAKPQGVILVEIGCIISDQQPNVSDLYVCGSLSTNPGAVNFSHENSGKRGWFAARYVTRRGDKGEWGQVIPFGIP